MIYHIEEVDVAVLTEIWMEGKAEHPLVAPASDFFADINNWRGQADVVSNTQTRPSRSHSYMVPIHQGNADGSLPIAAHVVLNKGRRENCAPKVSAVQQPDEAMRTANQGSQTLRSTSVWWRGQSVLWFQVSLILQFKAGAHDRTEP